MFTYPKVAPWYLSLYPTFNVSRLIYVLTIKCGFAQCVDSLTNLDTEILIDLVLMYITPVIYAFLGIYLYEVIPQQFGVRKGLLFCFKDCERKKRIAMNLINNEESSVKVSLVGKNINNGSNVNDGNGIDEDVLNEIKMIKNLGKNKSDYPLVVDGLSKVFI